MNKIIKQSVVASFISLNLIGCATISNNNIETLNNNSFKQKELFQSSLEQSIPMLLFVSNFQLAQIAYTIPGLYIEKPINPFDPSFAQCMNEAIISKNYQNSLNQTIDNYFTSVSQDAYNKDLKYITSNEYKQESEKFFDLFELFAKNQTLKENQDIFYPRFSNETNIKLNLKPSQYFTDMFNINKETPLSDYITNQTSACYKVQKLY